MRRRSERCKARTEKILLTSPAHATRTLLAYPHLLAITKIPRVVESRTNTHRLQAAKADEAFREQNSEHSHSSRSKEARRSVPRSKKAKHNNNRKMQQKREKKELRLALPTRHTNHTRKITDSRALPFPWCLPACVWGGVCERVLSLRAWKAGGLCLLVVSAPKKSVPAHGANRKIP